MDLYEVLGVKKEATQAKIKQTYKRRAMKEHPDRGGDADKFDEITKAYDILSDPELRAEYDRTGKVTHKRDPIEKSLVKVSELMRQLLHKIQEHPHVDPLELLKTSIRNQIESIHQTNLDHGLQIQSYNEMSKRIQVKGGYNYLQELVQGYGNDNQRAIETNLEMIKEMEELLLFLEDYEWKDWQEVSNSQTHGLLWG